MSGALPRAMLVFCRALLVLAVAVRLLASPLPALAQPLEVVDSTGMKVGSDVIGVQDRGPLVAFNAPDGRVYTLLVTQNGFEGAFQDTNNLFFTSEDCFVTGMPFLLLPSGAMEPLLLPPVAVVGQSAVYLPDPGRLSESITVKRRLLSDGTTCEPFPEALMQAFPAQPIGDLNTLFVPPFIPPFRVRIIGSSQ